MARYFFVKLAQRYADQNILNTFQLVANDELDPRDGCFACLEAMGFIDDAGAILAPFRPNSPAGTIEAMHITPLQYIGVECTTPYFPDGLAEVVFSGRSGGRGTGFGDSAPSFLASRIRGNRIKQGLNRAQKRFAAFGENDYSGQTFESGYLNLLENVAVSLSAPLSGSFGSVAAAIFESAVVPLERVPGSSPPQYQLFSSESDAIAAGAIGVQFAPVNLVTSQNSRKSGVGQ